MTQAILAANRRGGGPPPPVHGQQEPPRRGRGVPHIIETPLAYDPTTGERLVNVDHQAVPRNADVNEISNYVVFAASEDSSYATGTELVVDGGFTLGPLMPA